MDDNLTQNQENNTIKEVKVKYVSFNEIEELFGNFVLPREYLSASQIDMYMRCPRQYEFRYIKGIIYPPKIALIEGSALHRGFEYYYDSKIKNPDQPEKPEHVVEYAITSLEEELQKQEVIFDEDTDKDTVVETLEKATTTYITSVGEKTTPIAVEREIVFEDEKTGLRLLGYIDLLRQPEPYEKEEADKPVKEVEDETIIKPAVICDYKYGSKKWSADQIKNSLQFGLYNYILRHPIEIHNVVKHKKGIDIVKLYETFQDYNFKHLMELIYFVAKGITEGNFPPCRLDVWWCSPSFCGYWNICRGRK